MTSFVSSPVKALNKSLALRSTLKGHRSKRVWRMSNGAVNWRTQLSLLYKANLAESVSHFLSKWRASSGPIRCVLGAHVVLAARPYYW